MKKFAIAHFNEFESSLDLCIVEDESEEKALRNFLNKVGFDITDQQTIQEYMDMVCDNHFKVLEIEP